MRGKKAKKLRRMAEDLEQFLKSRLYRRDGKGTIFLAPGCTRAIYQRLKKNH